MLKQKLTYEGAAQTEDSDSLLERRLFSSSVPIGYSPSESSSPMIFSRRFSINHSFILLLQFVTVIILIIPCSCQMPPVPSGPERAEVDIRVSGACSPVYLSRRDIDITKYRPSIRFNPDKIFLTPKNPIIPGCIKIKALGVEIVRPVKNLIAEVEMRIGGTPDPNNPPLPCSRKIDQKVNQCPCAKLDGTCVFCDFCKQMKQQATQLSLTRHTQPGRKVIDNDCQCEVMQPGMYDIETEMCTPELDDIREYIPPEIQNNILEKQPISMFITVYLMDMEQRPNESYLSAFGKALLKRRMAQSTVACFLLGIDVNIGAAPRK